MVVPKACASLLELRHRREAGEVGRGFWAGKIENGIDIGKKRQWVVRDSDADRLDTCNLANVLADGGRTLGIDAAGNRFPVAADKPAIALCRCGTSKNKPFCDGSHKTCNFMAAERAPVPPAPPAAE